MHTTWAGQQILNGHTSKVDKTGSQTNLTNGSVLLAHHKYVKTLGSFFSHNKTIDQWLKNVAGAAPGE